MSAVERRSDFEECVMDCPHGRDIERDKWGRPFVNGRSKVRVSTLAGTLDDGTNLGLWKARTAVLGVCQPQAKHLRERAITSGGDDKVLREITEEALVLGGSKVAASRGSAIHEVIADVNRGRIPPVGLSESTRASVDAYRASLDRLGLTPILSEQFVSCGRWDAAGSYDCIYQTRDNAYVIGDVKTSAKVWETVYPMKLSMQLGAYAHGKRWCPHNGFLPSPPVRVDYGLLVSVPVDSGKCIVTRIDLTKAVRMLDTAVIVRGERKDQKQLNLGEMK